jgi:phytoene dehydrogenase-like protein
VLNHFSKPKITLSLNNLNLLTHALSYHQKASTAALFSKLSSCKQVYFMLKPYPLKRMKSIAIVGAGIGGCSAAYFARKNIPNVNLTMYDAQDRIGGRILTRKTEGVNLELGASFINETNKTILGLVKNTSLNLKRVEDQQEFAVWNGSKIIFNSNKKAALTNLRLLMRYKLSTIRTFLLLKEAKSQAAKLYQKEENAMDIAGLFESVGLAKWTTKTLVEILLAKGVSRTFIEELASPLTRTIYTQNADIGGLAGISSLLGAYGGTIYRLVDGNDSLPTHLAQASQAAIKLKQKVTGIEKTREGNYKVSTKTDTSNFDGVIIAAPLELAQIHLDGITKLNHKSQEYQRVYTKIMKGNLNPSHFGLNNSAKPPTIVLTTKEADPITQIGIQKAQKNQYLVSVSSPEPISSDFFNGVFKESGSPVLEHCWTAAYPRFKPLTKLPLSRLDERLLYLNSIEAAVSSMETATLSALHSTRVMKAEFS